MTIIEAQEKLMGYLRHNVKPLWKAKDIMFFPVKSVDAHCSIKEAKSIMVKYNINALPVLNEDRIVGIISRQIVEKAAFHKLEELSVQEYMSTDASTVKPDDSIERAKRLSLEATRDFCL